MNAQRLSFLLIALVILTGAASATYVSQTKRGMSDYVTPISGQFTNLSSQIIVRIPFTAMPNVKDITGYQTFTYCYSGASIKPDAPLHIRTYTYSDDNPPTYYVQGYVNIYNTSCTDRGVPLTITLDTPIDVESLNGSQILGVAFGFYTEANYTTGLSENWRFPYDTSSKESNRLIATYYPLDLSYSATVKDVNNNNVYSGGDLIYTSNIWLLGNFIFPPTPVPTPTLPPGPAPDGTIPLPGDCTYEQLMNGGCNNPPPIPNSGDYNYTLPNFSTPGTACPTCPGNETVVPDGTLASNSSGSVFLTSLGYCTTEGCTVDDLISFFYDTTYFMLFFSFGCVFYKGYKIYQDKGKRKGRW